MTGPIDVAAIGVERCGLTWFAASRQAFLDHAAAPIKPALQELWTEIVSVVRAWRLDGRPFYVVIGCDHKGAPNDWYGFTVPIDGAPDWWIDAVNNWTRDAAQAVALSGR